MSGSTFGKLFCVTTWGESHGAGLGAVIDGVPAGLALDEADIQAFLDRRKPGKNVYSTPRREDDKAEILSGIFEGRTTGTPISILIRNTNQRSSDYSEIARYYRPGHADYPYDQKYGFRDYRGGGRSSGRETIGRVCGGAIASKVLSSLGIQLCAYTRSIGPVSINSAAFSLEHLSKSPLCMPDPEAEIKAQAYLDECRKSGDSAGGVVECHVTGLPAGIGQPVFDKLDAQLGQALFSIGGVKAVEIGDGTAVAASLGSENNDTYTLLAEGVPQKCSNHAGGIYGGLSDGSEIVLRAFFKPTPSISLPQKVLFKDGSVNEAVIRGRHDPIIVPRAVVVAESMTAMVLLDLLLQNMGQTMAGLIQYYQHE